MSVNVKYAMLIETTGPHGESFDNYYYYSTPQEAINASAIHGTEHLRGGVTAAARPVQVTIDKYGNQTVVSIY